MAYVPSIPSPAPLLQSGEIRNIRMVLTFYDAVVDIHNGPSRENKAVIDVRVGQFGYQVERPAVTFSFDLQAARKLIADLRTDRRIDLKTLPVDCDNYGQMHEHSRSGGLRAFVAVFANTGRHLLDAALWALDENHQPEPPDLTFALAKFWQLELYSGEVWQLDRRDAVPVAAVDQWAAKLRALPLDPELVGEFRRFKPYSE